MSHNDEAVVDFWDYSGCSDVDEEDDGLLHDPDFADSGTAWLSDEPKERAIQIAAQRTLRRAEEEQVLYSAPMRGGGGGAKSPGPGLNGARAFRATPFISH